MEPPEPAPEPAPTEDHVAEPSEPLEAENSATLEAAPKEASSWMESSLMTKQNGTFCSGLAIGNILVTSRYCNMKSIELISLVVNSGKMLELLSRRMLQDLHNWNLEVLIAGYPSVAGCYILQNELKNGRPVYCREPRLKTLKPAKLMEPP